MNTSISSFEEGKYYVMSGQGKKWPDLDGPFDSVNEGIEFIKTLINDFTAPEMVNGIVFTHFTNNQLALVRDKDNQVIDAKRLYWNR